MSDDMVRYRSLVIEAAAGGFNPQKVLSHIEGIVDDSVLMKINVNKPFGDGVRIDDITMFVGFLGDEGDGDLAVNYTIEEPEIGEPIPDEHELMMVFYGGAYDNELSDILIQAGFSQAASRVHGSESGMQEEGRASYDAYDIADEVRKAISGPTSQIAMTLGKNILTKNGVDINNPEPKKAEIIKWMLTRARESAKVPFDVVVAAEALQQSGAKWPELDAILRSYKAIK